MPGQTISITSASNTTYSSYSAIGTGPVGNNAQAQQKAKLMVAVDGAAGATPTFTLRCVLKTKNGVNVAGATRVAKAVDFLCTVTAIRAGLDGASGYYLCTVARVIALDGTTAPTGTVDEWLDLIGASDGWEWAIGMSSAMPTNSATCRVDIDTTNVV